MHVFSSVVSPVHPIRLKEGRYAKALEEISLGLRSRLQHRVEGSEDTKPSGLSTYNTIGNTAFL